MFIKPHNQVLNFPLATIPIIVSTNKGREKASRLPSQCSYSNSLENFTSSKKPCWFLQIICERLKRKQGCIETIPEQSQLFHILFRW